MISARQRSDAGVRSRNVADASDPSLHNCLLLSPRTVTVARCKERSDVHRLLSCRASTASTLMTKSHTTVTNVLCAAPTSGAKWSNCGGAISNSHSIEIHFFFSEALRSICNRLCVLPRKTYLLTCFLTHPSRGGSPWPAFAGTEAGQGLLCHVP